MSGESQNSMQRKAERNCKSRVRQVRKSLRRSHWQKRRGRSRATPCNNTCWLFLLSNANYRLVTVSSQAATATQSVRPEELELTCASLIRLSLEQGKFKKLIVFINRLSAEEQVSQMPVFSQVSETTISSANLAYRKFERAPSTQSQCPACPPRPVRTPFGIVSGFDLSPEV